MFTENLQMTGGVLGAVARRARNAPRVGLVAPRSAVSSCPFRVLPGFRDNRVSKSAYFAAGAPVAEPNEKEGGLVSALILRVAVPEENDLLLCRLFCSLALDVNEVAVFHIVKM